MLDALTALHDLAPDPDLVDVRSGRSVGLDEIARYWGGRLPAIVAHLDHGDEAGR